MSARGAKRGGSSDRWLKRQAADRFVKAARRKGYRSRAAFKLVALDDRFRLLRPGARVVDLGAAPGGWSQVAVERVRPEAGGGRVVGVDLQPIEPVPGATFLAADVDAPGLPDRVLEALGGAADLVLSDMAAPATGHAETDHLRTLALAEAAFGVARRILRPGGALIVKLRQGAGEPAFVAALRARFGRVVRAKPPASRAESAELYLVALDFAGPEEA